MTYASRRLTSKWTKTCWLLSHASLRSYIPRTRRFSQANLKSLLAAYPTVYFKPVHGSGGRGIIRLERCARGFRMQTPHKTKIFSTIEALFGALSSSSVKASFLLQQGIPLAKSRGCPFDIRVMVQKTNGGQWLPTALFTKLGRAGKVATNYNQGGQLDVLASTLQGAGFTSGETKRISKLLRQLGVRTGHAFDKRSRGFRELGLDVALDRSGRPWILEVNTRPQYYPLKQIRGGRELYRRITSIARQYGRSR